MGIFSYEASLLALCTESLPSNFPVRCQIRELNESQMSPLSPSWVEVYIITYCAIVCYYVLVCYWKRVGDYWYF